MFSIESRRQARSAQLAALTDAERALLCPTCIRESYAPYRHYDEMGKVTEGCIDEFHTGKLQQISESNRWHNRPEAKAFRRKSRIFRTGK